MFWKAITHKKFIELLNTDKSATNQGKTKREQSDGWAEATYSGNQQALIFTNNQGIFDMLFDYL